MSYIQSFDPYDLTIAERQNVLTVDRAPFVSQAP